MSSYCNVLADYLQSAPTPFHAVASAVERLRAAGFEQRDEADAWSAEPGERYVVTRNGSSLIAVIVGRRPIETTGMRLIGAHTDSPCLKLKPEPLTDGAGALRMGVEVYGGVLLNPWYDRALSLAGRVQCLLPDGRIVDRLIDLRRPIATVPSLAIHLDREANQKRSINPQTDIPPVAAMLPAGAPASGAPDTARHDDFEALLQGWIRTEHPDLAGARVLDHELCFYDSQPPGRLGLNDEFFASARLDNLLSCHACIEAISACSGDITAIAVLNDHEEVGSQSAIGAQGPFLQQVIERLLPGTESRARAISRSLLVSADNAHAQHPNYADRHDLEHAPRINGGPVLKVNANQRYASNARTQGIVRRLAELADVPLQTFVTRTDLACGSTIGPITAAQTGIPTLDIGVPQWAMHSIREICGAADPERLTRLLTRVLDCVDLDRPS